MHVRHDTSVGVNDMQSRNAENIEIAEVAVVEATSKEKDIVVAVGDWNGGWYSEDVCNDSLHLQNGVWCAKRAFPCQKTQYSKVLAVDGASVICRANSVKDSVNVLCTVMSNNH